MFCAEHTYNDEPEHANKMYEIPMKCEGEKS